MSEEVGFGRPKGSVFEKRDPHVIRVTPEAWAKLVRLAHRNCRNPNQQVEALVLKESE